MAYQNYPGREQKKPRKRTGLGILFFIVMVFCGVLSYERIGLEEQRSDYAKELKLKEKERKELLKEQDSIEEYKAYVQTKSYIEEIARDKLGLVYKDEIIFESEEPKN